MRRPSPAFPGPAPAAVAVALTVMAALLCGFSASPANAGVAQVAEPYAAGAWEQARALAGTGDQGARPAESLLWRSRLAGDPAAALELLREGLRLKRLAKPVRVRLALEIAELELGRDHPGEALTVLSPLLDDDELPGALPLMAARALIALGRGPRARELLAGVRPTDPSYAQSRVLLGDIAMVQGDGVGAQRWYDAADQADPELRQRTVGGRCRALLRAGHAADVRAMEAQLATSDPGSLELVEIRRALSERDDASAPRPSSGADGTTTQTQPQPPPQADAPARAPEAEPAAEPAVDAIGDAAGDTAGRYTLQFGAFADRAHAREFRQRHADRIDGLVIEEGRDARDQPVYRVRFGDWPDPEAAEDAARELARKLDLDVIVVDRQAPARPGG